MRLTPLMIATALIVLSGCGKSGAPQSREEVAAEMEKATKLKPGKYAMTMTMLKFDIPGAPPEAVEQMRVAIGKPQTMDYCLTPANAEKGVQEMLTKMNGDCTYSNFSVNGARVSGDMACKSPTDGSMKSSIKGTATEESSDIRMQVEVTQPGVPTVMQMDTSMTMKRLGDCAA
jgi:Protein of unknown function (DUF3617)